MKNILVSIFLLTLFLNCEAQFRSVGVLGGGGVSALVVSGAVEPTRLKDLDTYSMVFKVLAEYTVGRGKALGLEFGRNRLYYWKVPSTNFTFDDWQTEWTTNAVLYYMLQITDRIYLQTGVGLHHFRSDNLLGLMAAFNYSLPLSGRITMPLFFRVEPVFGGATPIAFNIGTGLKYNLNNKTISLVPVK